MRRGRWYGGEREVLGVAVGVGLWDVPGGRGLGERGGKDEVSLVLRVLGGMGAVGQAGMGAVVVGMSGKMRDVGVGVRVGLRARESKRELGASASTTVSGVCVVEGEGRGHRGVRGMWRKGRRGTAYPHVGIAPPLTLYTMLLQLRVGGNGTGARPLGDPNHGAPVDGMRPRGPLGGGGGLAGSGPCLGVVAVVVVVMVVRRRRLLPCGTVVAVLGVQGLDLGRPSWV